MLWKNTHIHVFNGYFIIWMLHFLHALYASNKINYKTTTTYIKTYDTSLWFLCHKLLYAFHACSHHWSDLKSKHLNLNLWNSWKNYHQLHSKICNIFSVKIAKQKIWFGCKLQAKSFLYECYFCQLQKLK